MELLRAVEKCPLLEPLSDRELQTVLLPLGQVRKAPRGRHLIVAQQRQDRFGVVLSGRVHVTHLFPDGTYSLITVLTDGDLIGADLVCTSSRISPYYAIAAADTEILWFPAALLLQPGKLEEPLRLRLLRQLLTVISNENMKKEYRLAILSQKGLRERIMAYLTMQAGKRRTNTFSIPFSREELASFLCVNRSALSHELSLLQKDGQITFRKNVFTVHER